MKKIMVLFMASLLVSCFNADKTRQELIGMWKGQNDTILQLYADSTFSVSNLPASVFNALYNSRKFDLTKISKLSYKGYWSVDKHSSSESLSLDSVSDKAGNELYPMLRIQILRSGFLQSGPPNRLQISLDSDGVEVYEFKRDALLSNQ